ncbi:MAG: hypothetical protein HKN29_05465 [Rhodothermales bacterium]|nr:hypothetical protein [Rhodothermales bacterium]
MQDLFRVPPSAGAPPNPFLFSGVDDDEDWMEDPDNWDRPWDEEEGEEEDDDDWDDDEDDLFDDFDDEEE